MAEVMFILGIVSVFVIVGLAVLGSSINQTFGDIQCALKYGQGAYMDTHFNQNYCFRAVYDVDGNLLPVRSFLLGKPIISNGKPKETANIALPPP